MYLVSFPKHREPATCMFISKYLYVANNMEILIYFHKKVVRTNWYFLHSSPTPCILMLSSIRCFYRHSNHLYFLIVIVTSLYISSPSSWRNIRFLKYKYEKNFNSFTWRNKLKTQCIHNLAVLKLGNRWICTSQDSNAVVIH